MIITWQTEKLESWKRHLSYGPEMVYTNKILGKHKTTDRANILKSVPRQKALA
jgi:hypothetical protein